MTTLKDLDPALQDLSANPETMATLSRTMYHPNKGIRRTALRLYTEGDETRIEYGFREIGMFRGGGITSVLERGAENIPRAQERAQTIAVQLSEGYDLPYYPKIIDETQTERAA